MKNKSYQVQLQLTDVLIDLTITAESLEDALVKAKTINVGKDILQKDIGWVDGDATVTGVFQ